MNRAVVYVRVSSADQVSGFSLDVQERVCRDFCERQGWDVTLVAREEGESAKTTDRRELQKLLGRLRRPGHGFTRCVVYDITRFTRETADYFALKGTLEAAGVRLVSVTQPLDDSPTGKFMGTIVAAAGTFENDIKREKTLAGMKEAIKRGIWPWQAPLGYLSARDAQKRAMLVHDPEKAPLVLLAFERIASGLVTQEEVREELRRRGLRIPRETFSRLIHNPIYCGRIVAPAWGLEGRLASKPIVSEETWRLAQAAIAGSPSGWKRSDLRPEFPLRWWTRCGICSRPLTGAFSQGTTRRHPYYRCTAGCQNVQRDRAHDDFSRLLESFTVPTEVWRAWEAVLVAAYERRVKAHRAAEEGAKRRLRELDTKDERIVAALLEGNLDAPTVKRMRARIAAERAEVAGATPLPLPDLQRAMAIGRRLAESPRATWDALRPEARPGFLRVAFPARLDYDRNTGFANPSKSLYLGHLTHTAEPSCEEWYPQRCGLRTVEGVELLPGWAVLGPHLEDQCQTTP